MNDSSQAARKSSTVANRILVVDDDDHYRMALIRWLVKAGYEVRGAANGNQASSLADEFMPEVVVTDIFMPDSDGLETIMKFVSYTFVKGIIAMSSSVTSFGYSNQLQAAKDFGAHKVFAKPVDKDELLDAVKQILKPQMFTV